MPSVAEHYERILSPVYAWMAGGAENALAARKETHSLPISNGSRQDASPERLLTILAHILF